MENIYKMTKICIDTFSVFLMLTAVTAITIILVFLTFNFNKQNNPKVIIKKDYPRQKSDDEIIREHDIGKIYDPLQDPTKRTERSNIMFSGIRKLFDIPTRGTTDTFRQMGVLIASDPSEPNKLIKLFGRQEYPNSTNYEYYVELNNGNDSIKLPLENKKEIYDNDTINIKQTNRNYVATIYKNESPRYSPHIL